MNIDDIYKIWDKFENSSLQSVTIELDDSKIKLKRNAKNKSVSEKTVKEKSVDKKTSTLANKSTPDDASKIDMDNDRLQAGEIKIKAPLVGTFYKAPKQGDEPFAIVGQNVKKGDVLGIVEAMKMMNDIVAPADGVVNEILVDDGELVSFDQLIMTLSKQK